MKFNTVKQLFIKFFFGFQRKQLLWILLIYPNPSKGEVHLDLEGYKGVVNLSLENSKGQFLLRQKDNLAVTQKILNQTLANLPSDTYFLTLEIRGKILRGKIILVN